MAAQQGGAAGRGHGVSRRPGGPEPGCPARQPAAASRHASGTVARAGVVVPACSPGQCCPRISPASQQQPPPAAAAPAPPNPPSGCHRRDPPLACRVVHPAAPAVAVPSLRLGGSGRRPVIRGVPGHIRCLAAALHGRPPSSAGCPHALGHPPAPSAQGGSVGGTALPTPRCRGRQGSGKAAAGAAGLWTASRHSAVCDLILNH
ncbi:hypothetical protein HaLaN_26069 [Haematococcus lacustris]|uniref:Uncharacterized protein n=1 Tax=Haematococcus lacustris TaxID=44745 RepID=A0A6A0A5C9_HAELA|nr:hypothetical protein HaLaN_26069 [Haematococcus lacustris]